MKNKKVNRFFFSAGLLAISAGLIIGNFKLSEGMQGFLLGLGITLTIASFIGKKAKEHSC